MKTKKEGQTKTIMFIEGFVDSFGTM